MIEMFENLSLSFAIVTESWLKQGAKLHDFAIDLEAGEDIGIIHCSRPGKKGRTAGGGVAILYKKKLCQLSQYKVNKTNTGRQYLRQYLWFVGMICGDS